MGLVGNFQHAPQATLSSTALAFVLGITVNAFCQTINQLVFREGCLGQPLLHVDDFIRNVADCGTIVAVVRSGAMAVARGHNVLGGG